MGDKKDISCLPKHGHDGQKRVENGMDVKCGLTELCQLILCGTNM